MENVTDALKIAFGVFVLVAALSITILMYGKARETSDIITQSSDKTLYESLIDLPTVSEETRTVGIETIVPVLYRYYIENYTVIFLDENEHEMEFYERELGHNKWYDKLNDNLKSIRFKYLENTDTPIVIGRFDKGEEILRDEAWINTQDNLKKRIDIFLNNDMEYDNYQDYFNALPGTVPITGTGFIEEYGFEQFEERVGEREYEEYSGAGENRKIQRIIVYKLLN